VGGPPYIADYVDTNVVLGPSGEAAAALQSASEALWRARDSNDLEALAVALVEVARPRFRLGQYEAAAALAQEALAVAAPDAPARVDAWQVLGNCAAETGSPREAEILYRQAADLAREIGHHRGFVAALHGLAAAVYIPRGSFDLALAADQEAYQIAERLGHEEWLIFPLATMAMACQLSARREGARSALSRLHSLLSPHSIIQGYYLCVYASLALDEGDLETGQQAFAQARSIAEATGEPWLNVTARLGMSRYHRLLGDGPAARAWAEDALTFANRVGYRHEQGKGLIEQARAAWLCGDLSAAEANFQEAIGILYDLGASFDLARAQLLLAALLLQQGDEHVSNSWQNAAQTILKGGYTFLLEQERTLAFPLVAAYLNSSDPTVASVSATLAQHLQHMAPEPLRIVTLGKFEVWQARRRIDDNTLRSRRGGELLALLLLSPGRRLSLEQVTENLWPDRSPSAARIAFHHASSTLRRALEPDLPDRFPSRYIEVEEGQVTLHLPANSQVDFETFEMHCRQGEWEDALVLYSGDLLPSDRYADWASEPRERLALKYQRALLAAARERLTAGRTIESLEACQQLLALEPWHEQAVLLAMRASVELNDLAGARRIYRRLERTLHDELGTVPQDDLQALYRSLTPSEPKKRKR